MPLITLKCKNCGSSISIDPDSKTATCTHCGSTFLMVDLLDEKDMSFSKSITPENLQQKIDFAEALKKGDTYLFQGEYKLAEEQFKRAIELNDTNYKGYLGVVKAKTSNINKVPDTKEFIEFAKYALKYVDKDDESYVKSELAKLDMLVYEKEQKDKALKKKNEEEKRYLDNKADAEKFWGKITTMLIVFFTIMILSCIFLIKPIGNGDSGDGSSTYEISTAAELYDAVQKSDFLSSTIVIKNDIDFENSTWTPVGDSEKPFTGKVFGNGYTLSNLKIKFIKDNSSSFVGFIGYAKNSSLLKIKFSNVSIESEETFNFSSTNYVGLIAGRIENTEIKKCEVDDTCEINLKHSEKNIVLVGGITGYSTNSELTYSYSNANILVSVTNIEPVNNTTTKYFCGGLIGQTTTTELTNCYSSSSISVNLQSFNNNEIISYCGGLVGFNATIDSGKQNIIKCFFAGNISNTITSNLNKNYVAGIVAYGTNFEHMDSNFALFTSSNFSKGSEPMQKTDFNDFSSHENSVNYVTLLQTINHINAYFSSEVWENINTTKPKLK